MNEYNAHTEYIRSVPGAKSAVLMIHGILCTPNFFRDFVKEIPESISVYNILLDGHGAEAEDFTKTSMIKWREQVHGIFDALCQRYESIVIVGHSMGSLFAIEGAVHRPDIVKSIFLVACPLKVFVKPIATENAFKVVTGKINEKKPMQISTRENYSIAPDPRLWKYIPWAPRFIELFSLIRKTRVKINDIKVPTHLYMSKKDEFVSIDSIKYFKDNPNVDVTVLESSYHYFFTDEDYVYMIGGFNEVLATLEN